MSPGIIKTAETLLSMVVRNAAQLLLLHGTAIVQDRVGLQQRKWYS